MDGGRSSRSQPGSLRHWLALATVPVDPHGELARSRVGHVLLGLLVLAGCIYAWYWRGVYEDGFIYMRVAENLALGHGPVFNPGERLGTETNTDFLWTFLVAAGIVAGLDLVSSLVLLSMVLCALSFVMVAHLARQLFPATPLAPHVAVALLAANHTYAAFAANGFGTMVLACSALAVLVALLQFARRPGPRTGLFMGLALTVLLLCRLDAALFVIPAALGVTWVMHKSLPRTG